jgi:hypothetical protein
MRYEQMKNRHWAREIDRLNFDRSGEHRLEGELWLAVEVWPVYLHMSSRRQAM